jgi:hypothetical protein
MQEREEKLEKGRAKWQRDLGKIMDRAEKLRREYDPLLREIQDKFNRKLDVVEGDSLVCPQCGEGDKGNKMNGKRWCLKCNVPLVPKSQAKWLKIKVLRGSLKEDIDRLAHGEDT